MNADMKNAEGYTDTVPFEAMKNIGREERKASRYAFRPLVYICCPFSDSPETNIEKAKQYCRFALDAEQIPLCPVLMFPQFMDETNPDERDLAIFMDIILMGKCKEVWAFDRITSGMASEISRANRRGQKVRYWTKEMKEVGSL